MMLLTTPEPTVRPPSRNRFTVLFTIFSLIFLVFQRFCLLKACGILVTLKFGAKMEPVPIINHMLHVTCALLACSLHATCMSACMLHIHVNIQVLKIPLLFYIFLFRTLWLIRYKQINFFRIN
jgi:hypothetical protein